MAEPLTPETALAMATTARGVVADAEQVKRLWSNACGGLREMEEAWARDTLAVLDALGFEVRAKDETAEVYDCELDPPCSEEEWKRRVAAARAVIARFEAGEAVRLPAKRKGGAT